MPDGFQPFVLKNTSHGQFSMPTMNRSSRVREHLEYISLGTRFEPLASGHWEGPGMRSADFRGSLQLKSHGLVVYEIRRLSFCPKECLSDSNDIGSPALPFPLFFQSAAVECCSGRFLRGQLYCSVNKASCWLQPWLVTSPETQMENTLEWPAEGSVLNGVTVV